jgi:ABC-type dipeptide/oligopeptide/nickel transport system ATPase subunit
MNIIIQLENIQHISSACISIPFDGNKIFCIVGRNGVGKTSIIKALRNLRVADTYRLTSDRTIFSEKSRIVYKYNELIFEYTYDSKIGALNSKSPVPARIKNEIEVELPMPYGERFNYFQKISNSDTEIRQSIVLEHYKKPEELIELLSDIYGNRRFENLREIEIKGRYYYCQINAESRYIREDYFSSGEYFVISLYKKIRSKKKLIVIDEIDISLDAAAQVHLIKNLRKFCEKYSVNIVFTTHSLAMMRMLEPSELLYLENSNGQIEHQNASYNYVKSILFGFSGWDRYILTEDKTLEKFLAHIISQYVPDSILKHRIIYVGGGSNTVSLMRRNTTDEFFAQTNHVISILDGDQIEERYTKSVPGIFFVPFPSVEKEIYLEYNEGKLTRLPNSWKGDISKADGKGLFLALKSSKNYSSLQLFDHIFRKHRREMEILIEHLRQFLHPG